jgi:single-strand DNA-binding protein
MSSRSLNKVQLIGNLTRDPELRYTPQGTPVCTIGIATNRSWVDSSGKRQEETEFHRVVAWSKLAELCDQLLFKGRKVFVEGRLQTRRWTSQDGAERQTTEIVIDDMIILDNRRRGDNGDNYDEGANMDQSSDDGISSRDERVSASAKASSDDQTASDDDQASSDDDQNGDDVSGSDSSASDDSEDLEDDTQSKGDKKEDKKSKKNEELSVDDIAF